MTKTINSVCLYSLGQSGSLAHREANLLLSLFSFTANSNRAYPVDRA